MLAILQFLTKFVLTSGVVFGLVFMLICTVFVIVSVAHGDIRIKMVRDNDENKDKQVNHLYKCRSKQWTRISIHVHQHKTTQKVKEIEKMQGTVKWFHQQRGYGFLTDSEGKDVFFHHSNIQMDGFRCLDSDDIVNFELGTGKNGKEQAVNIVPVLTMKMIEGSLKVEKLYVKTVDDPHAVCHLYMVVNEKNEPLSSEHGMSFLDLAVYAGFDVTEETA